MTVEQSLKRIAINQNVGHRPLLWFLNSRYHKPMKKPPDNPEFARFTSAMRHIMSVSKAELQRRWVKLKVSGERDAAANLCQPAEF
jgi:hypothetical protein